MAAVIEQKPDTSSKFGSQVDEQIAQATSRIRVHDLMLGGLTLASLVAVYATAMILLDKQLNLTEWVRQASLIGFGGVFATVGYFLVVRPLRNRINPLYAAARVEETIEDAKNSVTGYVDAREKGNVHGAVQAAMSAKAAKAVGEADVNRAVDHRSLIVAGGVLIALLIALAVLFFVFRPNQFTSLIGRAFVPFSSKAIETRTKITLLKPDPAEPTLTTGQTVTVAVHITGKVPAKNDPTRVRLLLRHNPTDPNYEELPLQEGDTTRDWNIKIPEYLVQNGFWYKVAAGDTETPEYRVTVRSLPLFTDFDVSYEYPKYTRRLPDKATDPNLRAYRGTKITLLARTNREVKEGLLKFEGALAPVAGKIVPGKPDTLSFSFTATEATRYRLSMLTTTGERNADAPPFTITLDTDAAPQVAISKPEEVETTVPANGQLAVDGVVGDDFGIDKVRLRLRVENRELTPIAYEGGKSFRREKDGTWPNDLAYKGSVDLTKLTFKDGQKFEPKENMVVEFWLEAIDNCTETKPVEGWGDKPQPGQVGKSETRRVRLTAPKVEPEDKKQLDQQKDQRQNEEKQHNARQQQKLDNEKRDPQQQQDPGKQPQPNNEPKNGEKNGEPKKGETPDGKDGKKDGNDPKTGESGKSGMTDPNMTKKDDPQNPPKKGGDNTGMGNMGDPKDPKDPKKKPDDGMGNMADPKNPKKKPDDGMGNMGDPKTEPKKEPGGNSSGDPKSDPKKGETPPKGGENTGMGNMDPNANPKQPDTAPPPRTEEDKKAEQDANKVKNELDKNKAEGGDAKPNPDAKPEEKTDPAQQKPQQPMNGEGQSSQTKEGPKPDQKQTDPKNPNAGKDDKNAASQSKPEGNLEQPPDKNGQQKPEPKAGTEGDKGNPSERREEPLGGNPGQDKPEPKQGNNAQPKEPGKDPKEPGKDPKEPGKDPKEPGKDPKEPGKDPMSGSTAKPPTDPKQGDPKAGPNDKSNPADKAGQPKPNVDPSRGQDKNPGTKPDPKQKPDPEAGDAKPQKAPPAGQNKPMPSSGSGEKQPDASDTKEPPKDAKDPKDPMSGAAETKPEPKKPMPGDPKGMGEDKAGEPGTDKPDPKADMPPKGGNNPKDNPNKEPGAGGKKLDEKQLKELEDAAKDLNNPDPAKRKEAQDKLDKAIGEKNRKELEQTAKDLQSPDKATRDAAQKKLEDMKKKAEELAKKDSKDTGNGGKDGKDGNEKGKELSKEEVDELAKKAGDLNSKDDKKREDAEKAFDEKLGKENRKKIQDELNKQPPKDPTDPKEQDDLRRKIEEQAKKDPPGKGKKSDDFTPGGGATNDPPQPEDPSDPKNKLKSAQLQLEEFEKNRYNKDLQDKLGWTQQQYDEFLKAQAERVKQLEAEQAKQDESMKELPKAGAPTIKASGGGKVETLPTNLGTGASGTGAVFAPPGFEDAKKRFAEEMRKLQQKK
ncbi:MAG: hypothetical protein C0467_01050 [Planctomycetaceae bacterium]|nr:hypothetical protein [Planctomycetaceae bacterium]